MTYLVIALAQCQDILDWGWSDKLFSFVTATGPTRETTLGKGSRVHISEKNPPQNP